MRRGRKFQWQSGDQVAQERLSRGSNKHLPLSSGISSVPEELQRQESEWPHQKAQSRAEAAWQGTGGWGGLG